MKKLLFSLLACLLLCMTASAAFAAESFSDEYFRDNDLYTFDVQDKNNVVFIESSLSAKARSFVHKYESSRRYSNTEFDILIVDYNEADEYPVFRLWIRYYADNGYLNIDSVSFLIDGKKYTFSDVSDSDWLEKDEDGYSEKALIKFGTKNDDFLVALEQFVGSYETFDALENAKITMTLHGRESIDVELGAGFLLDFMALKEGFVYANGVPFLGKADATPLSVSN